MVRVLYGEPNSLKNDIENIFCLLAFLFNFIGELIKKFFIYQYQSNIVKLIHCRLTLFF